MPAGAQMIMAVWDAVEVVLKGLFGLPVAEFLLRKLSVVQKKFKSPAVRAEAAAGGRWAVMKVVWHHVGAIREPARVALAFWGLFVGSLKVRSARNSAIVGAMVHRRLNGSQPQPLVSITTPQRISVAYSPPEVGRLCGGVPCVHCVQTGDPR